MGNTTTPSFRTNGRKDRTIAAKIYDFRRNKNTERTRIKLNSTSVMPERTMME